MTVWVFAGQGSQIAGMGSDVFERFPKECEIASNILGYSIVELCLQNPNNQLTSTKYSQPAIFFVNALKCIAQMEDGKKPDAVSGHSLGEYNALHASGSLELSEGLKLIQARGEAMEKIRNGGMLAVIGSDISNVIEILLNNEIQSVDIANYNSPNQIILSGPKIDLTEVAQILENQEFRCIELNVNGPFHSRYMEDARIEFTKNLIDIELRPPNIPVFSPSTVSEIETEFLLEVLSFQIVRPVYWHQTVLKMIEEGYSNFAEITPGDFVLTKLIAKIKDFGIVERSGETCGY